MKYNLRYFSASISFASKKISVVPLTMAYLRGQLLKQHAAKISHENFENRYC